MNKNILAIDPASGKSKMASKTGFAYSSGGKLIEYGTLEWNQVLDSNVRRFYIELIGSNGILVIEDQYTGLNKKTGIDLVRAAEKWVNLAQDLYHIEVCRITPQEWQTSLNRWWRFGKKKDIEAIEYYIRHRWCIKETEKLKPDELSAIALLTTYIDRNFIAA